MLATTIPVYIGLYLRLSPAWPLESNLESEANSTSLTIVRPAINKSTNMAIAPPTILPRKLGLITKVASANYLGFV